MFASAVRQMRLERGLTQEAVARKGGLGHKYPGQVEREELVPRLPAMIGLAQGLGMQPAEFFHRIAEAFEAAEAAGSYRAPPAIAGRMTSVSPSPTAV